MNTESRVELAPGYSIARVIQGCWQLSDGHRLRKRSSKEHVARRGQDGPQGARQRLVHALADRALQGKTTFDCADIYTGVEDLLAQVRKRILELGGAEPQIHTKCVPDLSQLAALRREDLERSIDQSLRRLGVERLDLVQFHWWDLDVPGFEQAGIWLDEMRNEGKIRCLGATNFCTESLARLLNAGVPIVSHQVQYSLLDRRPAQVAGAQSMTEPQSMTELCREYGVTLLCYGTLAGGLLTSRFLRSGLPDDPRNRSETKYRLIVEDVGGWDAVAGLLEQLERIERGSAGRESAVVEVGKSHNGVSPEDAIAPLAVRWVLEQPCVGAAIVGASPDRDLGLHDVFRLAPQTLRELEQLDLEDLHLLRGDVYELERDRDGRHGRIMRYDLQTDDSD